ncbi:hypothetical protein AB0I28_30980 [Phytomonospora sp. NPDC050363]|uniref:hypothetical protein n=1 Tax=Phytomonospora sp. NPDC050363 TaxID=3155642 RepID=UPI0034033CCD
MSFMGSLFREARYLLGEEPGMRDPGLYHSVLERLHAGTSRRGRRRRCDGVIARGWTYLEVREYTGDHKQVGINGERTRPRTFLPKNFQRPLTT